MTAPRAGHRTLPHTADTRVRAWGPTFADCVAQAVLGAVASFVDASGAAPVAHHELRVAPGDPGDLVVAVLDEVIYLLDVAGQVPVGVAVASGEDGHLVRFDLADVAELPQVGAVPKAVSLHGLRVEEGPDGWLCEVTLDV